jgi:hypothetical protein
MDNQRPPSRDVSPLAEVFGSAPPPAPRPPERDPLSLRPGPGLSPHRPAAPPVRRPGSYQPRQPRRSESLVERFGLSRVIAAVVVVLVLTGGVLYLRSGGDAAATAPPAPTATPVPTPTPPPADTPRAIGTPAPTPKAVPTPIARIPTVVVPGSPAPASFSWSGRYTRAADGSSSISCDAAQVGRVDCSWPIAVGRGNPIDVVLTWSGTATMAVEVDATDGSRLGRQSGVGGTLHEHIEGLPPEVIVTVSVVDSTQVTFQTVVSNKRS